MIGGLDMTVLPKGYDEMGMTDYQFTTHLRGLLRELKAVRDEIKGLGSSKTLGALIADIESQLERP